MSLDMRMLCLTFLFDDSIPIIHEFHSNLYLNKPLFTHQLKIQPYLLDGKTYDAFVSYLKGCQPENREEHTFAVETLPRVLEKHFGYKLCIFERDVVPGGGKKENNTR